jgi:hypothetical protein
MTVPPLKLILIAFCPAIALLASFAAPPSPAAASKWALTQLPPIELDDSALWEQSLSGVSCPTESSASPSAARTRLPSRRRRLPAPPSGMW